MPTLLSFDIENNTCSNEFITGMSISKSGKLLTLHLYCKRGHEQALYETLPSGITYVGKIFVGAGQVLVSLPDLKTETEQ